MRKLTMTALMTAMLASVTATSAFAAQEGQAQQQQQQAAAPQQAQPIEVNDEQLEQFAEAQASVNEIRVDAMTKLKNSEDPKEAQEIQQQANQEMVDAVQDTGLSVEDYNLIARAVQNDTSLQSRLQQMSEG
ncbi:MULTISPECIES: DUF4168 domain-containing protein [Vibrio]|uniref:DUF4168 domain-containing protein n=1 Tax=Vibrio ostreae TaxID=2841925 RepID=A0A975UCG3_9VIBR|nr:MULTISPECIES: DUF4168 domain-containing protein [Vibrio]QXO19193.1 DUF4168 domain-containing protein [Vibrio ostreae]